MIGARSHVSIRHGIGDDERFVTATWFRSMLGSNRAPRVRRRLNALIDRVLDDKTTKALVAERDGRIVGWLVYATPPVGRCLHYCYVRDDDRGEGIARRLIEQAWPGSTARIFMTCEGPSTQKYIARHPNVICLPVEEVLGR